MGYYVFHKLAMKKTDLVSKDREALLEDLDEL